MLLQRQFFFFYLCSGSASVCRWPARMYRMKCVHLSSLLRFWAFIWKLGSRFAWRWKLGFGSASKWCGCATVVFTFLVFLIDFQVCIFRSLKFRSKSDLAIPLLNSPIYYFWLMSYEVGDLEICRVQCSNDYGISGAEAVTVPPLLPLATRLAWSWWRLRRQVPDYLEKDNLANSVSYLLWFFFAFIFS
jgi:hypothetical protein